MKTTLTTGTLRNIINRGSILKRLRYSIYEHDAVIVNPSDHERFHACPPFFGVALESRISQETLLTYLNNMERVADHRGEPRPLPDRCNLCFTGVLRSGGD